MKLKVVNIGHWNTIAISRILAVANPSSSPIRKIKDEAKMLGRLIDLTEGRRTRSVIILDDGTFVLSSLLPETVKKRIDDVSEG